MARPRDPDIDQRVVTAVTAMLAEVGYAALTMESVAARANVSKPALYRRWPTLAHLVFETQARTLVPDVLPDTGSFADDIRLVLQQVVRVMAHADRAMLADQFGTMALDPEFARDFYRQTIAPLNERAAAIYHRAVDRGQVRAGVDAVALMRDLTDVVVFRLVFQHDRLGGQELQAMVDRLAHGVAPRPGDVR